MYLMYIREYVLADYETDSELTKIDSNLSVKKFLINYWSFLSSYSTIYGTHLTMWDDSSFCS